MCLALPGRIVECYDGDLKMAKVQFGTVLSEVCLAYTPEAEVGDYVIVHVGFAIQVLDQAGAERTLAMLSEEVEP